MEIKTLKKYKYSTLNGVLIRELKCYDDGRIVIVAEDNTSIESYVDDHILNDGGEYGDYIICDLQDLDGVCVSKY